MIAAGGRAVNAAAAGRGSGANSCTDFNPGERPEFRRGHNRATGTVPTVSLSTSWNEWDNAVGFYDVLMKRNIVGFASETRLNEEDPDKLVQALQKDREEWLKTAAQLGAAAGRGLLEIYTGEAGVVTMTLFNLEEGHYLEAGLRVLPVVGGQTVKVVMKTKAGDVTLTWTAEQFSKLRRQLRAEGKSFLQGMEREATVAGSAQARQALRTELRTAEKRVGQEIAPGGVRRSLEMNTWQNAQAQRFLFASRTGRAMTEQEFGQFETFLRTYHDGTVLLRDGPNIPQHLRLRPQDLGMTYATPNGQTFIVLRDNASNYIALHEYLHLRHYELIRSRAQSARQAYETWTGLTTREAEQIVYDELRLRYWHNLTSADQEHARWYVAHSDGFAWE
jgi:hypothetical protein